MEKKPDPNSARNPHTCLQISYIYTITACSLYSHTCQNEMSISRCVQRWQIFAYVKQAPSLFEALLNRLPHFTTDTLSHSKLTPEYLVMQREHMYTNTGTLTWARSCVNTPRIHRSDISVKWTLVWVKGLQCAAGISSLYLFWKGGRKALFATSSRVYLLFYVLIFSPLTNQEVVFRPRFEFHPSLLFSETPTDHRGHSITFPSFRLSLSVSICLRFSLIFFYQIPYGGDSGNTRCFCTWGVTV